ncbi:hypothetical protein [Mediterranea massiliensis]|uniref:hypothetical protein n=1 Tax=Mediterranea massiliensis TaxID=1841865 RepID=UPI0023F003E5|nr:hypothetical protein [Mediterranea massiliensis]
MNYAIEEYVFNDYNASSKARKDISYFVHQFGFKTLIKNDKSQKRYGKITKAIKALQVFAKVFTLNKNDVLFIQTSHLLLKPILRIKIIRKFKVIYLIHDIFSLCYNTEQSIREHRNEIERDINLINACDCVIAHNQFMIDRLRELGCKTSLVSLNIFDYACSIPAKKRTWDKNNIEIAFAGNISKSRFLNQLDKNNPPFQVNVYGSPQPHFQHLNYKGCVDADILPNVIEGHFGLIWEGDYEVNLENNYNQINNPHKLSMYIVAGLPIITLKGSAAGFFIEKEGIGFTVTSLDQIHDKITHISEKQYNDMTIKCLYLRNKLINGSHIKEALCSSLHSI